MKFNVIRRMNMELNEIIWIILGIQYVQTIIIYIYIIIGGIMTDRYG